MAPQRRMRMVTENRKRKQKELNAVPEKYPCPICGYEESVTIEVTGYNKYARGRKFFSEHNDHLSVNVAATAMKEAFYDLVATIKCKNCDQKDSIAKGPPFRLPLDFYSFWFDYYNNLEVTNPEEWQTILRTNKVMRDRHEKVRMVKERARRYMNKTAVSEVMNRTSGRNDEYDSMMSYGEDKRITKEKLERSFGRPRVRSTSRPRSVIRAESFSRGDTSFSGNTSFATPATPTARRQSASSSRCPSPTLSLRRQPTVSRVASSAPFLVPLSPISPNQEEQVPRTPKTPRFTPKDAVILSTIKKKMSAQQRRNFKRKLPMDGSFLDLAIDKKIKSVADDTFPSIDLDNTFASVNKSFVAYNDFVTNSKELQEEDGHEEERNVVTHPATPRRPSSFVSATTITPVYDDDD